MGTNGSLPANGVGVFLPFGSQRGMRRPSGNGGVDIDKGLLDSCSTGLPPDQPRPPVAPRRDPESILPEPSSRSQDSDLDLVSDDASDRRRINQSSPRISHVGDPTVIATESPVADGASEVIASEPTVIDDAPVAKIPLEEPPRSDKDLPTDRDQSENPPDK